MQNLVAPKQRRTRENVETQNKAGKKHHHRCKFGCTKTEENERTLRPKTKLGNHHHRSGFATQILP